MSVGAKGRGITRPARSAKRGGRPGKPLRPVKRTALRGGTGGSHEQTRALRAWPHKDRGVWLVQIPLAPITAHRAGIPASSSRSKLSSLPPLLAAGLARRRAGRASYRAKGSEPPCGKDRPDHPTARPVDHRPLLEPWGLARACSGPAPPLPRLFRRGAGQPGSRHVFPKCYPRNDPRELWITASAVPPVRDEMGGAGRPGPVCGGMARRDIQPCSAAGRIAPTSSGGGRSCRPEPGTRPEGDARSS